MIAEVMNGPMKADVFYFAEKIHRSVLAVPDCKRRRTELTPTMLKREKNMYIFGAGTTSEIIALEYEYHPPMATPFHA